VAIRTTRPGKKTTTCPAMAAPQLSAFERADDLAEQTGEALANADIDQAIP
jgi:hypothetical protein